MCRPLLHRAPVNPASQEANETAAVTARVAPGRAAILALAKVATVLGDAGISIDRMRQYGHAAGAAPVLIVTHKTTPEAIDHAMQALPRTGVITGDPVELRIEEV